ncbi:hypothetical protein L6R53_19635 [Myxococcota bacterium]|nr:hypothetical protein [Myxococcota bacterium]
MSGASSPMLDQGMSEALRALRDGEPDRAASALLALQSQAAGAGPLSHAAVLVRLAQARLGQARAATCPVEAAARAAQAHGVALEAMRRLRQAGAEGSTLEVRAARARGEAALLLQAVSCAVAPEAAGCSLGA